jgi:hypothetical protein
LIYTGSAQSKGLQATRLYLKENGATTKGAKRAWILDSSEDENGAMLVVYQKLILILEED